MLPHYHFAIAAIVAFPAALLLIPEALKATFVYGAVLWALVAGVVAFIIDLDMIVLVRLRARREPRLRPFVDLENVARDFKGFINVLAVTGVLRTGLVTHVTISLLLLLSFYVLSPTFLVPAAVGVVTHLVSDLPYIPRALKGDGRKKILT